MTEISFNLLGGFPDFSESKIGQKSSELKDFKCITKVRRSIQFVQDSGQKDNLKNRPNYYKRAR